MRRCLRVLDKAVVGIWYLVLGFEFNAGFSLLCVLPRESAANFFSGRPRRRKVLGFPVNCSASGSAGGPVTLPVFKTGES